MMNASTGAPRPDHAIAAAPRRRAGSVLGALLLTGGLAGALILAVSQFMTLADTRVAGNAVPVDSITVGSEHAYALLPIALVAAVLAYGVWSAGSRPALLAIGVLGLLSLVIALARDLPYAQQRGVRLSAGHYVTAANSPSGGLYFETGGAMILLVTSVSGFILIGPPEPERSARLPDAPRPRQTRV
jgi:hypothetical protein